MRERKEVVYILIAIDALRRSFEKCILPAATTNSLRRYSRKGPVPIIHPFTDIFVELLRVSSNI